MEQHETKTIHYYDRDTRRILCGIDDPTAHWTIRTRVNCATCSALLRERRHAGASPAQRAAPEVHTDA